MTDSFDLEKLRFPIGKFKMPDLYSDEDIGKWIHTIETLPALLRKEVEGMDNQKLDSPYRPGGWTVRQVVHHLADSHMNSYCRFKLALTEEVPGIRPYFEERWAELEDAKNGSVDMSLHLLDALHMRWAYFMRRMKPGDWERRFFHPGSKREFSLNTSLALYAWHCEHHLNHIIQLKKRMGWL